MCVCLRVLGLSLYRFAAFRVPFWGLCKPFKIQLKLLRSNSTFPTSFCAKFAFLCLIGGGDAKSVTDFQFTLPFQFQRILHVFLALNLHAFVIVAFRIFAGIVQPYFTLSKIPWAILFKSLASASNPL